MSLGRWQLEHISAVLFFELSSSKITISNFRTKIPRVRMGTHENKVKELAG